MTRYDEYPDHPLCGVPQEVLDVARASIECAVETHDVEAEMAHPIADAVVAELRIAGFLYDLTWRSEKPDSVGWWLWVRPSKEGPTCESTYWNERYLNLEHHFPEYDHPTAVWAKIELPEVEL